MAAARLQTLTTRLQRCRLTQAPGSVSEPCTEGLPCVDVVSTEASVRPSGCCRGLCGCSLSQNKSSAHLHWSCLQRIISFDRMDRACQATQNYCCSGQSAAGLQVTAFVKLNVSSLWLAAYSQAANTFVCSTIDASTKAMPAMQVPHPQAPPYL